MYSYPKPSGEHKEKRIVEPRELIKEDIEYDELKEIITSIKNPDHKALLAFVYGSAARIGEVVRYRKDGLKVSQKDWVNPPVTVDMIKKDKLGKENRSVLIIELQMEKFKGHKKHRRTIIYKEYESWLCDIILDYIDGCKAFNKQYLFNYSTGYAEDIFAKYIGKLYPRSNGNPSKNIHVLRDWRITHWLRGAVTGDPVPTDLVARLTGHTSVLTQAKYYDLSTVENYADKL